MYFIDIMVEKSVISLLKKIYFKNVLLYNICIRNEGENMDISKVNSSKNIEKYSEKYIYINGEELLDFTSVNFLGLRDDQRIKDEMKKGIDMYSLNPEINKTIANNTDICFKLANKLKEITKMDEVNIYSSGYNVNVAILSNLFNEKDVIFSDSLNSINLLEGIYLSGAKLIRYKHNDIEDLKNKLEKYRKEYDKACVVTDSLFTIDGKKANLNKIGFLKEKYAFYLFVDETNSLGIFGESSGGITEENESLIYVDLMMGYLYRTFGSMGEYVAMKKKMDDMLMQNSLRRDLINKSMITPIEAIGAFKALELFEEERWRKNKVLEWAVLFREKVTELGFSVVESNTPVVTIEFETDREVIDISKMLYEEKILVSVTISKTTIKPRIRIFLGAHFEKDDINNVIKVFKKVSKEYYVNMNPTSIK